MLKYIPILLFILSPFSLSYGQKAANLMKNYVPSPEAYALMQYEAIPVSKHTGVPSVNIPIYTIQVGNYSLPISLNYHASGIKVAQEASWVGLGWSLSAGGTISRSICGNDDEFYYANHANPVPIVKYLSNDPADIEIEGDIYEGSSTAQNIEPDIFQYNFDGYSGKFYFRRGALKNKLKDKFIVSNPEQNLRIEIGNSLSNGFTITTSENIKYIFSATEYIRKYSETYSGNTSPDLDPNKDRTPSFTEPGVISSWYLSRIEYPTKDTIYLDYTIEQNTYLSPLYLTEQHIDIKDSKCFFANNTNAYNQYMNAMPIDKSVTVSMQYTDRQPRIQTIRWKNGHLKLLPATQKRLDIRCHPYKGGNGAYPLGSIELYQKDASLPLRTFSFNYSYFRGKDLFGNEISQPDFLRSRLKLASLAIKGTGKKQQIYQMEYDEQEPLPQKNCYSCDAWGYFNGSSPWIPYSPAVIPFDIYKYKYSNAGPVTDGLLIKKGATFSLYPDEKKLPTEHAKIGVLTALTSPTGGRTEFKYENNTILDRVDWIPDISTPPIEGYYIKEMDEVSKTVTIDMPYSNGYIAFSCIYQGDTSYNNIDYKKEERAHPLITFSPSYTLWGIPDDAIKSPASSTNRYMFEFKLPCKRGTYRLKLQSEYPARLTVSTSIYYGNFKAIEKKAGGIRIAEIKSPVSTLKYSYLDSNNLPSGRLNRESQFSIIKQNMLYSYSDSSHPIGYYTFLEYNSNSLIPLENPYNNYFMGYTEVTTTEEYQNEKIVETDVYYNEKEKEPRGIQDPGSIMPLNGRLLEHRVYSNGTTLKQKTVTQYKCEQLSDYLLGFKVSTGYPPYNYRIDQYHIAPAVVFDTLYATAGDRTICHPKKTEYDYHWRNYQVLQTTTTESGKKRSHHISYTIDYSTSYYKDAVEKYNYVSTPVEEKICVNDDYYGTKKVCHIHYQNEMLSPWKEYEFYGEKIRKDHPTFDGGENLNKEKPEITYQTYDKSGCNTSLSTRMGQTVVFVRGYHHQYIIAQISNATVAEVQKAGVDFDTIADKTKPSDADWEILHSLRTKLPRSLVTVIQYEPLVGIVSETDPRGMVTRYTYDEFGRLDEIIENKNGTEYVLQKNEYKYANEK